MYRLAALAILCSAAACQHDIYTLFPPGLEPFDDDDLAANIDAPVAEALVVTHTSGSATNVYGEGYVFAPVKTVWAAAQNPKALIATCSTDQQVVTQHDESGYEMDFIVAYTVNNFVTVQWDDQYRGDIIQTGLGSDATEGDDGREPSRTMIKHQKVDGSSFISLSDGSTQMIANADDTKTQVHFVEHLAAVESPEDQVQTGMQHEFDSLVSIVHGGTVPACP
jgi:hypothetical protein